MEHEFSSGCSDWGLNNHCEQADTQEAVHWFMAMIILCGADIANAAEA